MHFPPHLFPGLLWRSGTPVRRCPSTPGSALTDARGGKREPGESDIDTLVREISEELCVRIDPATAVHVGTFEAQAHGKPDGVLIRMTCYTAQYSGTLAPASEIAELTWLSAADTARIAPVDHLVFAHLQAAGILNP
jgi:8-oxo-dGTP pyrophosphatase MutT (NUDIX family)